MIIILIFPQRKTATPPPKNENALVPVPLINSDEEHKITSAQPEAFSSDETISSSIPGETKITASENSLNPIEKESSNFLASEKKKPEIKPAPASAKQAIIKNEKSASAKKQVAMTITVNPPSEEAPVAADIFITSEPMINEAPDPEPGNQQAKTGTAKMLFESGNYNDALDVYKNQMNSTDRQTRQQASMMAARCYLNMGQTSFASILLESLASNGSGAQKRQAKRLLKDLGKDSGE